MSLTLVSIEVWRDSASSAVVTVYREGVKIDRVKVIPGDCLDLELGDGTRAILGEMPRGEEALDEFAAQDAAEKLEQAS